MAESELRKRRDVQKSDVSSPTRIVHFERGKLGIIYQGNEIVAVRPDSPAAEKGVKVGWRMLKVNGRTCPDGQEEMRDMLGAAAAQSAVEITFDTSQAPTKLAPSDDRQTTVKRRAAATRRSDERMLDKEDEQIIMLVFLLIAMVLLAGACLVVYPMFSSAANDESSGRKANDIDHPIDVELEHVYRGIKLSLTAGRQVLCPEDHSHEEDRCPHCHGRGVMFVTMMGGMQMRTACPYCGGHGSVRVATCPRCGGHHVIRSDEPFELTITPGMPLGHRFVFAGQGHQAPHMRNGDAVFTLKTKPHETFRRDNDDLHATITISLVEALVGFRRELQHIDHVTTVSNENRVLSEGDVVIVRGEGMPVFERPGYFGDLHVHVAIEFPESLSAEQKQRVLEVLPPDTQYRGMSQT